MCIMMFQIALHLTLEWFARISFPLTLLWLSLASVLFSNIYYRNHSRLVDGGLFLSSLPPLCPYMRSYPATGSSLSDPSSALASVPFLRRLARPLLASVHKSTFTSRLLSNPFTLAPASFSIILLYAAYIADRYVYQPRINSLCTESIVP